MAKSLGAKQLKRSATNLDALLRVATEVIGGMGRFFDRNPLPKADLLASDLRVLTTLSLRSEALTMSALARQVGVAGGTLTPHIKRLLGEGMIQRERSNEDDRVVLVRITSAGRHVLTKNDERMRLVFAQVLSRLSPEKQEKFVEAHETLAALLKEIIEQEDTTGGEE